MDILYTFDVHLKVFAKQTEDSSSLVEVRTKLEAIGPIFNAWYHPDGGPAGLGNAAITDACIAGLLSSLQAIADENELNLRDLLEISIERLRKMSGCIEDSGTVEDDPPAPISVTHSAN